MDSLTISKSKAAHQFLIWYIKWFSYSEKYVHFVQVVDLHLQEEIGRFGK